MSKANASRNAPEEIDAFLAALPDDMRSSLERVRNIIRETAPECTERVSYKIPIFRLRKDLVGISAVTQLRPLRPLGMGQRRVVVAQAAHRLDTLHKEAFLRSFSRLATCVDSTHGYNDHELHWYGSR